MIFWLSHEIMELNDFCDSPYEKNDFQDFHDSHMQFQKFHDVNDSNI